MIQELHKHIHCLDRTRGLFKYYSTLTKLNYVTRWGQVGKYTNWVCLSYVVDNCHANYTGCFYFTIGNLSPCLRSSLKAIQIVALAQVSKIQKYGIAEILSPIIKDLAKLETVWTRNTMHSTQLHAMHI